MIHLPQGQSTTSIERISAKVTSPPWFALYLIPTGSLVFPLFHVTFGTDGPVWALALIFFGQLLLLRFGTAFLRRFLPMSRFVEDAWLQNRALGKSYDSYQWQKLVWIGFGILIHAGLLAGFESNQIVLAVMCLGFGVLGTLHWRSKLKTKTFRSNTPNFGRN